MLSNVTECVLFIYLFEGDTTWSACHRIPPSLVPKLLDLDVEIRYYSSKQHAEFYVVSDTDGFSQVVGDTKQNTAAHSQKIECIQI